jgi:hypothetical protein
MHKATIIHSVYVILITSDFFLKKIFRGYLSLTQENHHFIVQIGKKINAVNGQNYQEHALPHITQLTITYRLA